MTRDYSATREARRYVARCVANLIDPACGHDNGFIYEEADTIDGDTVDKTTIRRREKALRRLVARLRKEAEAP